MTVVAFCMRRVEKDEICGSSKYAKVQLSPVQLSTLLCLSISFFSSENLLTFIFLTCNYLSVSPPVIGVLPESQPLWLTLHKIIV